MNSSGMPTKEEFFSLAMGADVEVLVAVIRTLLNHQGIEFAADEEAAMRAGLVGPDLRMQLAHVLTDGAAKAGVFG